jgi:tetratricopeptide (TPR) repeat protein
MYEQIDGRAEAAEAIRRAAESPSPTARIRLAELAMTSRRPREAADLLTAVAPAVRQGSRDLARLFAYAEAHFLASQGHLDGALAAWERTGEIEGRAGLELLSFLVTSGQGAAALPLAERLLTVARLGGPVGAAEVLIVYDYLREVAAIPDRLVDVVRIVENLPDPARGMPALPRQRFLASLYERQSRPAEALVACERAAETGVFDVDVLAMRARALRALGRSAEAAEAEANLAEIAPGELAPPVRSPILESRERAPQSTAAGAARR